jgi:hypothetical protein
VGYVLDHVAGAFVLGLLVFILDGWPRPDMFVR